MLGEGDLDATTQGRRRDVQAQQVDEVEMNRLRSMPPDQGEQRTSAVPSKRFERLGLQYRPRIRILRAESLGRRVFEYENALPASLGQGAGERDGVLLEGPELPGPEVEDRHHPRALTHGRYSCRRTLPSSRPSFRLAAIPWKLHRPKRPAGSMPHSWQAAVARETQSLPGRRQV